MRAPTQAPKTGYMHVGGQSPFHDSTHDTDTPSIVRYSRFKVHLEMFFLNLLNKVRAKYQRVRVPRQ